MSQPRTWMLLAFTMLAVACREAPSASSDDELRATPVESFEGEVVLQSDGDTVKVKRSGTDETVRVRFVGIDTPEKERREFRGQSQEPWASDASQALGRLLPLGTRVRVVSFGADPFGRVLGRVELPSDEGDAPSINEVMVQQGWALPLVFCGSGSTCSEAELDSGYAFRLRLACEAAEADEAGVFAAPALEEAPYEFRTRAWSSHETDWVGDALTHEYVSYAERASVPRCQQVVFLTGTEPERFGFRRAHR